MMTSSNGNIFRVTGHLCGEFTVTGEFPAQKPVTRSFDVFFDLRLNERLSKQSWFKTPCAHYDVTVMSILPWLKTESCHDTNLILTSLVAPELVKTTTSGITSVEIIGNSWFSVNKVGDCNPNDRWDFPRTFVTPGFVHLRVPLVTPEHHYIDTEYIYQHITFWNWYQILMKYCLNVLVHDAFFLNAIRFDSIEMCIS